MSYKQVFPFIVDIPFSITSL